MKINSRGLLINLFLVILSTFFAFFLSEVALRFMGHKPLYVSPERDRFWKSPLPRCSAFQPPMGWSSSLLPQIKRDPRLRGDDGQFAG